MLGPVGVASQQGLIIGTMFGRVALKRSWRSSGRRPGPPRGRSPTPAGGSRGDGPPPPDAATPVRPTSRRGILDDASCPTSGHPTTSGGLSW